MFSQWLNDFAPIFLLLTLIYFFITYIIHDTISYYVKEVGSFTSEQIGNFVSSKILYEILTGQDVPVKTNTEEQVPVEKKEANTFFVQIDELGPRKRTNR